MKKQNLGFKVCQFRVFKNLPRTIEFLERTDKDPPDLWWLFDFFERTMVIYNNRVF